MISGQRTTFVLILLDQLPFLGHYANSADPVKASEQGQYCLFTGVSIQNTIKMKHLPGTPKTRNGLIRMIRIDKLRVKMG